MKRYFSLMFGIVLKGIAYAFVVLATAVPLSGAQAQLPSSAVPRPVEAYKRAWPSQVPVLKPDPVLGETKVWETWVYDKGFAGRFEGFDPQNANPELSPGVHAIVFRTYKRKIFDQVPDMFVCEYSIYFDSRVRIPLSERDDRHTYPPGISHSFRQLRPARVEDAKALAEAKPIGKAAKSKPLIFADGKLDGRYANFALDYFPDLVPGMSMAALRGGDFTCKVIGPKRPESHHWIWLFGELPFNKEGGPFVHAYSDKFMQWTMNGTFDPGPLEQTLANGHVRVPEAFYEAVLPKVTLIKAVNECITYRNGYEVGRVRDIGGSRARHMKACEDVEREGTIYEYSLDGLVKGWHGVSF